MSLAQPEENLDALDVAPKHDRPGETEIEKPNCCYLPKWSYCGSPTKVSEALRLRLVMDYPKGWLDDARSGELDSEALSGYRFGIKYETRNLRMGPSVAFRIDGPRPSNAPDPQVFFDLASEPFLD